MSKIDDLLAEVQRLKDAAEPVNNDALVKAAEAERDAAVNAKRRAEDERDAAVAELAKVNAAVEWTMGKMKIADIVMRRSEDLPAAEWGWLNGWGTDPEDTHRIAWINRHGRMSLGDGSILFALPHAFTGDDTFPEIYNFRHFVDLCRRTYKPPQLPLP